MIARFHFGGTVDGGAEIFETLVVRDMIKEGRLKNIIREEVK